MAYEREPNNTQVRHAPYTVHVHVAVALNSHCRKNFSHFIFIVFVERKNTLTTKHFPIFTTYKMGETDNRELEAFPSIVFDALDQCHGCCAHNVVITCNTHK